MTDDHGPDPHDLDVLMATSKVFTAVLAQSLDARDRTITATQLRALVVLETHGPTNLSRLADGLGVDPSTASRTCDQLVRSGLVSRTQDTRDRRHVSLRLSRRGAGFLGRVMSRRRAMLARITEQMSEADRRRMVRGLASFVGAAEVVLDPGSTPVDP